MKRCRCCRQKWPPDCYFEGRSRGRTYARSECKACHNYCYGERTPYARRKTAERRAARAAA